MSFISSYSVIMIPTSQHRTVKLKIEIKFAKYLHHHAYNPMQKKLPLHPRSCNVRVKLTK